jgi:NAD(P)-dependent dehydrogenase (short-subunit alcohol dehydrogenase family)
MSLTKESVAVITGASSGIGRALALRLAAEPVAGIAMGDVNVEALAETAKMIQDGRARITTHKVNVADEDEMGAFAEDVVREHGRVTHVINNAGVALAGSCREVSLEDIRWLMDINFWGVVFGTKFFLPFLEKEQSAHIVNVSSLYGLIAPPGQAAYSASKFAVRGFTEALRHELKGTNIAVSVVHPGGVKTNIANSARIGAGLKLSPEELQDRLDAVNLLLSHTTPEQAAEVIVKGIKGRNPRILIGRDARLLSLINRLFPCRYGDVIDRIRGGLFSNT